jgi:hypothetical protein
MKLTRAQIKEGLQAMPIDRLLLGSGKTLTAKQKKFAEEVAKGSPKAKAYREAYESQALPQTQASEAYKLAQNPAIASMIEAQKLAIEAQKYTTPLHLRALTIHNLTQLALDQEVKPAQRLKALELLGKITEVALFTERREVVQVTDSAGMREKLLQSLQLAINNSTAIDAEYTLADDLLSEIAGGAQGNDEADDHAEPAGTEPASEADDPQGAGA